MNNKRSSGLAPVVFAGIALASIVGGIRCNGRPTDAASGPQPTDVVASPQTAPSQEASPSPAMQSAASPTPRTEVTIYTSVNDADGSHLEPKTIPLSGDASQTNDPAHALNAMAKLPDSPLPKGTIVNKAFVQKNGLGIVDFNPAFKANFTGGDRGEGMVLQAITQTMGQFGAKQVQITVGGKKIDSLGGMESLQKPLLVAAPQDKDESAQ